MINFKHGAFTAKVIDNGQYSEASAVVEAVRDEIHGPVLVDPLRSVHDHPEMANTLPAFLQAQREAFLSVYALGALVVDQVAFPAQHGVQPRGTELTPLFGQFTQA